MEINRFCNGEPLNETEMKNIVVRDPLVLDILRQVRHRVNQSDFLGNDKGTRHDG